MGAIPPRSPHRLLGGHRRGRTSCPPAGLAVVLEREEPSLWVQVRKQAVLIERRVGRLDPVERGIEQQQDVVVAEVELPDGVEVPVRSGLAGSERSVARLPSPVAPSAASMTRCSATPLRCRS